MTQARRHRIVVTTVYSFDVDPAAYHGMTTSEGLACDANNIADDPFSLEATSVSWKAEAFDAEGNTLETLES